MEYGFRLTMADYLPLSAENTGHLSQSEKFQEFVIKASQTSKFILVTDIKGLGVINREEQDRWISRGAKIEELVQVHEPGSRKIAEVRKQLDRVLKKVLRLSQAPPSLVSAGDEAVWGLPDLDPDQYQNLLRHLKSQDNVHYVLNPVIDAGTSEAFISQLGRARTRLKVDFPEGLYSFSLDESSRESCLRGVLRRWFLISVSAPGF